MYIFYNNIKKKQKIIVMKKNFLDNMIYIYIGCNADVIQTVFRFE